MSSSWEDSGGRKRHQGYGLKYGLTSDISIDEAYGDRTAF